MVRNFNRYPRAEAQGRGGRREEFLFGFFFCFMFIAVNISFIGAEDRKSVV